MTAIGTELTRQLLDRPGYLEASTDVIPERFRIPEPDGVQPPHFMTVDFGLVREPDGQIGFAL